MIDVVMGLLRSPFVWLLLILIAGAVLTAALWEREPLCQYCNNDGDPCPWCGGYRRKR